MSDAGAEAMAAATGLVEQAGALIERRTPYERTNLLAQTPLWDPSSEMTTHPIIGHHNSLAPEHARLVGSGTSITGDMQYGTAYQGPDGLVHGGVIAGLFDALQATTASAAMGAALTHTLTIRYRRPTPLWQPLAVESHVDRIEGRKAFTVSTIKAHGEVTAESTGFFVRAERPDAIGD